MSIDPEPGKLCLVKSSKNLFDWKLCILCQESKGTLIDNPREESYQKLLDVVKERASLPDGKYVDIQEHLKQFSKDTFIEKKNMWHRSCYSNATNSKNIQRASDHLQHAMFTGSYSANKRGQKRKRQERAESETPGSSTPFTRSATEPLKKSYCFFCQKGNGQITFNVRTENAG